MNIAQQLWWKWNQPVNEARRVLTELVLSLAMLWGLIWAIVQLIRFAVGS